MKRATPQLCQVPWLLLAASAGTALAQAPVTQSPDAAGMDKGKREHAEESDEKGAAREALADLVDTAVQKLAEQRKAEAFERFGAEDYPAALKGFQEALGLNPNDAEAAERVGYLHDRLGNQEQAELYFRKAIALDPERAATYVNLGDLLSREHASQKRIAEAADMLARARELQGNRPEVIIRQARVAVARGRLEEAERFYREHLGLGDPDDALRLELGDFYRSWGRAEEALSWYRRVDERGALSRQAAQRVFEMEVDEQARRLGFRPRSKTVPPRARALASKGRILAAEGRHGEAERILQEAIRLAPEFAMPRANLGDVLRETGRHRDAELNYLRALAIGGSDAEIHVRLAELYLSEQEPNRTSEGTLFLERALAQRPDWTDLHLKLAQAHRAAGDLPRALFHVNRYLAEMGKDGDRPAALQLKAALVPLLHPEDNGQGPEARHAPSVGMDAALLKTLSRARAHLERGATDAALAELRRFRTKERGIEVLNLEAQILHAAGRLDEAAAVWRRSLKRAPRQADVHAQLGMSLAQQGQTREARKHLVKAEALGDRSGAYQLARLDTGPDRGVLSPFIDIPRLSVLADVAERLDSYLAGRGIAAHHQEAEALRAQVRSRIMGSAAALVFSLIILFVGGGFMLWRFWGGTDVPNLLARYPQSSPDVQRILSAVRHEVLKHNTMALQGLADTLSQGSDASDKARHCKRVLFGDGDEQGASDKLDAYLEQLRQIGRAHKLRLNLVRKDRALSALHRGFRELKAVAKLLDRADETGPLRRRRLLRGVSRAARLLNTEGYRAIGELLDRIRVFHVGRESLTGVFERVRREPAFAGHPIAALQFDSDAQLPCAVSIPESAFEDIVANLMRNALQSSLRSGPLANGQAGGTQTRGDGESVEIGLGVHTTVDAITGLARVAFAIRDRSEEQLTDEMLRGRYIERGLGLTADLVSRYDGSLSVAVQQPGWSKAVVLTLPRA